MKNDKIKNILIISYLYFPSEKIGAQRWTKIGKELIKKKHNISVLSIDNGEKLNDNHSFFKTKSLASILRSKPSNIYEKILYNFWIRVLPFFTKYNFYDLAIFDKKNVIEKAKKIIINNKIDIVIATGAPFSLCYYNVELKKSFKNLVVINDFRDPWTWNNRYGHELLSEKRKSREIKLEKEVVEKSDYVLVPVNPMKEFLISKYPTFKDKVKIIPHFFDLDKMPKELNRLPNKKINFIYGGSIYPGTMHWYEEFSNAINSSYDKVSISIYSQNFIEDFKSKNGLINLKKGIKETELMHKIKNSDYYIACYPEIEKDFISTKFYQIIYLKTPIILISPKGVLSEFIKLYDLGIHILPDQIKNIDKGFLRNDFSFNFNVDDYDLNKVTNKLLELI
tara:strand:- start:648 stop:1829 length:1182 start_codon:yes stop_codon:yes gene_type:complete